MGLRWGMGRCVLEFVLAGPVEPRLEDKFTGLGGVKLNVFLGGEVVAEDEDVVGNMLFLA